MTTWLVIVDESGDNITVTLHATKAKAEEHAIQVVLDDYKHSYGSEEDGEHGEVLLQYLEQCKAGTALSEEQYELMNEAANGEDIFLTIEEREVPQV